MPETLTAPAAAHVARAATRGASVGFAALAVPETIVSNAPIAARLGVEERWIVERTGILERHVARPEERLSDLATAAGRLTLERAGMDAAELDLLLVATTTQDELTPNAAPLVAAALGATRAGAIDVGAACTAFVAGLGLGAGQIEAGRADSVLLIGADVLTRYVDPDDKRTAALFGDGAGAVLMTAAEEGRTGPVVLHADGTMPDLIRAPYPEPTIRMRGHETFKHAVARIAEVTVEAMSAAGVEADEIDLFVYHQANRRITRAVGERLALPAERVVDCIDRYGNTSAASIPIALDEAWRGGKVKPGDVLVFVAFGAGLTWANAVVRA